MHCTYPILVSSLPLYMWIIVHPRILHGMIWSKQKNVLLSTKHVQPWWLGGRACDLIQVGCHSAMVDRIPLEDICYSSVKCKSNFIELFHKIIKSAPKHKRYIVTPILPMYINRNIITLGKMINEITSAVVLWTKPSHGGFGNCFPLLPMQS